MADGGPAAGDPMTAPRSTSGWRRMLVGAPIVLAVGLALVLWPGGRGDEGSPTRAADPAVPTVDVVASGATLATVEELLAAGDVVVVATVEAAEAGRAITDPQDPNSGIRTSLFELAVEEVLVGAVGSETIVVEHETALLDGTPITVNGIGPPRVGQRGLYVLVDGSGSAFPHAALVSPEGWAPLDGGRSSAPPGAGDEHPLVGLTVEDLRIVANG